MEPVTQPAVDRGALLSGAMARVTVPSGARMPAVEVDIAAALPLRAQDAARGLTAAEGASATKVIENSGKRVRDGAVAHDQGRRPAWTRPTHASA
ncbi:hypothetical protein ACF1BE_22800 [Streptomyces sp. NPDC014991]|uniref:hypothetical protein n=1 Tax=Streptomyces sp. NPDC014991 TaxID=3364935 RepID=UPI0036F9C504